AVPGVGGGDAGPTGAVVERVGDATLRGVRVGAGAARFDVDLRLTVRPVPLPALAEAIRAAVLAAAASAGLAELVGAVNVVFADLAPDEEAP
ncbi:MAG: hypothetical protein M3P39_05860, partial [Actinomycetota bacterium]|nr:hypothetical protein [Actinomycetota bacterium]